MKEIKLKIKKRKLNTDAQFCDSIRNISKCDKLFIIYDYDERLVS